VAVQLPLPVPLALPLRSLSRLLHALPGGRALYLSDSDDPCDAEFEADLEHALEDVHDTRFERTEPEDLSSQSHYLSALVQGSSERGIHPERWLRKIDSTDLRAILAVIRRLSRGKVRNS
jgi:hypothetical protein